MCGIAGIVSLTGKPIETRCLVPMLREIAHRGPDDEGFLLIGRSSRRVRTVAGLNASEPAASNLPDRVTNAAREIGADIAFAHCRFSIIDLSPDGHQPMVDPDTGCAITYNGEIYNYIELREELIRDGVTIRTASDTEVLLKAYIRWGQNAFLKFNGFWALAIYDPRDGRVVLCRDRVGKKPLFWSRIGDVIYFASEIKSLLQVPEIRRHRAPEESVIYEWFRSANKDRDEKTFFKNIFRLLPAHFAVVDRDFPYTAERYWRFPAWRRNAGTCKPEDEAVHLRELLLDAVKVRMRADVPIGVTLSGGLDSSALAALSAKAGGAALPSFTIKVEQPEYDESGFARSVADFCGSKNHMTAMSDGSEFWAAIRAFTWLQEEPYHSPNLRSNQLNWEWMRAQGIKVQLTGAAGDELFAGYGRYFPQFVYEQVRRFNFTNAARNIISYTERGPGLSGWSDLAVQFASAVRKGLPVGTRFRRNFNLPAFRRPLPAAWRPSPLRLTRQLPYDLEVAPMRYWLTSGDRGSMGVPIEQRAPFLDYRVIEFAAGLPSEFLIRDGWHKWILRKALQRDLPEDVVWRRRKMGFPFPIEAFFASSRQVLDVIRENADNPMIDLDRSPQFFSEWRVVSFVLWYEYFMNENYELFDRIEEMAPINDSKPIRGVRSPSAFMEGF